MKRTQKGDHKALEMLMFKYQRHLNRLTSRFIQDEHEVYDVTREVMIRAYRALANFCEESAFYIWLCRIGINTTKSFLTTSGRQFFISSGAANGEGDILDLTDQVTDYHTPEAEIMNREILQAVEASTTQLPDDMYQATTLREMDGSSYEEVAWVVDCPTGTVRSRIFEAHELITKDLRPLLDTSEDQRRQ